MEIFPVQDVNHLLRVGIRFFVKKHSTPVGVAAPVIPVLDEAIDGNLALAIFLRDGQKLIAGRIMLLALPVAISPFAIHRGLAGQIPVSGNDVVQVFAADEIVINIVGHLRPKRRVLRVVGKNGFGIIVPEQPIARRGNQEWRDRLRVGLHQLDGASAIVHVTGLVLPQAVNPLVGRELEILPDTFDPAKHFVVSAASCTTNCLVPMVKVLEDSFGLRQGLMTTIHAYTNEPSVLDLGRSNLRRARAAAVNIIPSRTAAARATSFVVEAMKGRLDGQSLRVPVVDGSITDLTVVLGAKVGADEINEAFRVASETERLRGILVYNTDEIVSSEIVGSPR